MLKVRNFAKENPEDRATRDWRQNSAQSYVALIWLNCQCQPISGEHHRYPVAIRDIPGYGPILLCL